jgi:hypothetical protein
VCGVIHMHAKKDVARSVRLPRELDQRMCHVARMHGCPVAAEWRAAAEVHVRRALLHVIDSPRGEREIPDPGQRAAYRAETAAELARLEEMAFQLTPADELLRALRAPPPTG